MSVKLQRETNLYDTDAIQDGINVAVTNYDTNLGQARVFNKLTNNGAAQGIFMEDGQLYINMSYLQTGTLKLGGVNNTNGLMQVYNASGTLIVTLSNGGMTMNSGSINLGGGNFVATSSGAVTVKNLTANDYINVDGSNASNIKIPVATGSNSFGYTQLYKCGLLHYSPMTSLYLRAGPVPYDSTLMTFNSTYGLWLKDSLYYTGTGYMIGMTQDKIHMLSGSNINIVIQSHETNNLLMVVYGGFACTGTKQRIAETKDYGNRSLYCYETPTPMFGDVGEGTIADDGKCYVMIDNIFAETVSLKQYQVTLQKYGQGDCWVSERKSAYFVVEGTPGLSFGWELKAKQSDYDQLRLEKHNGSMETENNTNYAQELVNHIEEIQKEREVA